MAELLTLCADLLLANRREELALLERQFPRLLDAAGAGSLMHIAAQLCDTPGTTYHEVAHVPSTLAAQPAVAPLETAQSFGGVVSPAHVRAAFSSTTPMADGSMSASRPLLSGEPHRVDAASSMALLSAVGAAGGAAAFERVPWSFLNSLGVWRRYNLLEIPHEPHVDPALLEPTPLGTERSGGGDGDGSRGGDPFASSDRRGRDGALSSADGMSAVSELRELSVTRSQALSAKGGTGKSAGLPSPPSSVAGVRKSKSVVSSGARSESSSALLPAASRKENVVFTAGDDDLDAFEGLYSPSVPKNEERDSDEDEDDENAASSARGGGRLYGGATTIASDDDAHSEAGSVASHSTDANTYTASTTRAATGRAGTAGGGTSRTARAAAANALVAAAMMPADGGPLAVQLLQEAVEAVQYMLRMQVPLHIVDRGGCIPLHYAASGGWPTFRYAQRRARVRMGVRVRC